MKNIWIVVVVISLSLSIVLLVNRINRLEKRIDHVQTHRYLVPMISPDSSGEWNLSALQKAVDVAASQHYDIIIPKREYPFDFPPDGYFDGKGVHFRILYDSTYKDSSYVFF